MIAKLMQEECECIPGRTNMEKYEIHYMYYRSPIHCTDIWRSSIHYPGWQILQSKKALSCKHTLFPKEGIRVQLDILYCLNPKIAGVPFERALYNKWRVRLREKYGGYADTTDFDAEKIKALHDELDSIRIPNRETNAIRRFQKIYTVENTLEIIRFLVKRYQFPRDVARMLYFYVTRTAKEPTRDAVSWRRFQLKLFSLYFELTC